MCDSHEAGVQGSVFPPILRLLGPARGLRERGRPLVPLSVWSHTSCAFAPHADLNLARAGRAGPSEDFHNGLRGHRFAGVAAKRRERVAAHLPESPFPEPDDDGNEMQFSLVPCHSWTASILPGPLTEGVGVSVAPCSLRWATTASNPRDASRVRVTLWPHRSQAKVTIYSASRAVVMSCRRKTDLVWLPLRLSISLRVEGSIATPMDTLSSLGSMHAW